MEDPQTTSIFDIPPDGVHEARLDAEAESAYQAGQLVPHERVREWLSMLAKGEKGPPPRA